MCMLHGRPRWTWGYEGKGFSHSWAGNSLQVERPHCPPNPTAHLLTVPGSSLIFIPCSIQRSP